MDRNRRGAPHAPLSNDRRPMYEFGGSDSTRSGGSYRPGDFSYRPQYSAGPRFPEPSRQPQPPNNQPRPQHMREQRYMNGNNPPRGPANQRRVSRKPYKPYSKPPPTADRPLLNTRRSTTPDQLFGMNGEGNIRFDLSAEDADESRANDSSQEHQPGKRAKTAVSDTAADNPPKWSNPDPYTSLPPVDDENRVKKDVVHLIRSARISTDKQASSRPSNAADFISFDIDMTSETENIDDAAPVVNMPSFSNVPTGPKADRNGQQPDTNGAVAPGTSHTAMSAGALGPPPGQSAPSQTTALTELPLFEPNDQVLKEAMEALQDLAGSQDDTSVADNSRKFDKKRKRRGDGEIVTDWQAISGQNATPWYTVDHSNTREVGIRLHKEICDFYEFVKPKEFENKLRRELISRVASFLRKCYPQSEVSCFGSFAAGLYLPNADMDLVVLSNSFMRNGRPGLPTPQGPKRSLRNFLFKFAYDLEYHQIARTKTAIAIHTAKVPIVKYVDKVTGLRVDISFENDTGLIANKTYQHWKAEFPAMPIIVTLVKQFLMMRGLNEVHTGGLGGFSVSCLVVSLLQHMPQVQSQTMDPMQHLGEVLMNFFDFYGNKLNTVTTGICVNPPHLFPKHLERQILYNPKKPWSLSIIDPNRRSNDISSGSSNILMIFKAFSQAYDTLQSRMSDVTCGRFPRPGSLLGPLYRGNYHLFEQQRAHLRALYTKASAPRLDAIMYLNPDTVDLIDLPQDHKDVQMKRPANSLQLATTVIRSHHQVMEMPAASHGEKGIQYIPTTKTFSAHQPPFPNDFRAPTAAIVSRPCTISPQTGTIT